MTTLSGSQVARQLFDNLDTSGDGKLQLDELEAALFPHEQSRRRALAKQRAAEQRKRRSELDDFKRGQVARAKKIAHLVDKPAARRETFGPGSLPWLRRQLRNRNVKEGRFFATVKTAGGSLGDSSQASFITFKEWCTGLSAVGVHTDQANYQKLFGAIDLSGDGKLGIEEVRRIVFSTNTAAARQSKPGGSRPFSARGSRPSASAKKLAGGAGGGIANGNGGCVLTNAKACVCADCEQRSLEGQH